MSDQLSEIRTHFEQLPITEYLTERQMVGVLFDRIERLQSALQEHCACLAPGHRCGVCQLLDGQP